MVLKFFSPLEPVPLRREEFPQSGRGYSPPTHSNKATEAAEEANWELNFLKESIRIFCIIRFVYPEDSIYILRPDILNIVCMPDGHVDK
jgi:hypothetical protein